MALLTTRSWQGRPLRENGKDNIDAAWFNGDRIAGLGSYSFSKIANITYDLFTATALNEQIAAFELEAKEIPLDVIIRPTDTFEGGGAGSVLMSLGITGDSDKYFPVSFDVMQESTVGHAKNTLLLPDSWSAKTQLYIYLESDVNVDTLTDGEAEIYISTVTLP